MDSKNLCAPCSEQGRQNNAERWCLVCEESLCSDCTSHHKTLKATKTHRLVDIEIASNLPSDFSTQQFCTKHNEIPIEYYCTDHDDIFCRACVAEAHRQCEKVVAIDIVCKNAKKRQLDDASKETRRIMETVQSLEKEIVLNRSMIDDDSAAIEKKISQVKKQIMDRINKLESTLLTELHSKTEIFKKQFDNGYMQITEIKKKTESHMQKIRFICEYGTERQAYILAHNLKTFCRETGQSVKEIMTYGKKLSFSDHPNAISSLGTLSDTKTAIDIGYPLVKLKQAQFPSVKSTAKKFEFSYKFYTNGTNILGMTATNDQKLMLCDYTDKNVILLYAEDGRHLKTITMKHKPFEIVPIPDSNRYAVSLPEIKSIQFVHSDILYGGKMEVYAGKMEEINFCSSNYGIAATNQNIFTGDKEKILILNTNANGNISKQIKLHEVKYITALENGKCYVTNDNKTCRAVDADGNVENCTRLDCARKVVVDRDGYVYIAGGYEGNIHRLKADLTPDMTIKHHGLKNVDAICFNKDCSKLFIANNRGESIVVLNCV